MNGELQGALEEFRRDNSISGKGALSVMLVVTRQAKTRPFPIDPADLITKGEGQVLGLGKGAVQTILAEYGIDRTLAEEGGRTSRKSMGNMRKYVEFLNDLQIQGLLDFEAIEEWWIARVKEFFAGKGFTITFDQSKSLRFIVEDLLEQAAKRQKQATGTMYVGAVLQHLIGAKLSVMLQGAVQCHGFAVADAAADRGGDFTIEDVAIHVTTTPSESLMDKCADNLNKGLRPVIVTTADGVAGALSLAKGKGIEARVDIIEASQYIATNFYEWSRFKADARKVTVANLVEAYNRIVEECETDPSLKISLGKRN
jgi:hypothetical protein